MTKGGWGGGIQSLFYVICGMQAVGVCFFSSCSVGTLPPRPACVDSACNMYVMCNCLQCYSPLAFIIHNMFIFSIIDHVNVGSLAHH